MATITMSYGSYTFNPIPLLNFARVYNKTEDGRIISITNKISLDGTLTPYPTGVGGLSTIMGLKDELGLAFNQQGCVFKLECDGMVVLSGNPRLGGLSFKNSPSNWVNGVGYSVDLEYEDTSYNGEVSGITRNIASISDDWNIEPIDARSNYSWALYNGTIESGLRDYKITHNLSAQGTTSYSTCGGLSSNKEAWEYAQDFCSGNMAFPTTGLFGITHAQSSNLFVNHSRTQSLNKKGGKYSLVDTWIVYGNGSLGGGYLAQEDYTIDIKTSMDSDLIIVGIQGSIKGLEQSNYTNLNVFNETITRSKWANASGYFSAINGTIFPRALTSYQNLFAEELSTGRLKRQLNPIKYTRSIGQSLVNGTISYNYEFNNKLLPYISGALAENINFTYDYPQDVYASIDVLGRTSGPVIQLAGTRTPFNMNMTVDLVVPAVSGYTFQLMSLIDNPTLNIYGQNQCPHLQIKSLMSGIEQGLSDNFNTLVKTSDKIAWAPHDGKYNRSVSWLFNSCGASGTAVRHLP
jgi:hypothetical protein